ncbi:MAG: collagen-like protein [Actinobacteria bacterium]|nr:collagen-like protein [Actinomycetota bacterium]
MARSTRGTHRRRPRLRLTYANVVSTLCLFAALGGGAYAAGVTMLPRNSVGAAQIRKGAVRSPQVKDGSLLARDFRPGQLPAGAQGPRGAPGPAGPQGQAGPAGPAGPIGPSEAFNVTLPAGPKNIALSPSFTTVLELPLGPGTFVLDANVVAANKSTTTGTYVRCDLFSDRDPTGVDNYPVYLAPEGMQAIPLQGLRVVEGSASTQFVACRKSAEVTVEIGEDPQLTAILVGGTIH